MWAVTCEGQFWSRISWGVPILWSQLWCMCSSQQGWISCCGALWPWGCLVLTLASCWNPLLLEGRRIPAPGAPQSSAWVLREENSFVCSQSSWPLAVRNSGYYMGRNLQHLESFLLLAVTLGQYLPGLGTVLLLTNWLSWSLEGFES